MRLRQRIGWIVAPALVIGLAAIVGLYLRSKRPVYPHGPSHCCIKNLMFDLRSYAKAHHGHYPSGGPCAEASLSYLYWSNQTPSAILRGMIPAEETTEAQLRAGKLLGPESCGWQYVEGLTLRDVPELALLWCKEPLAHNGQRTKDGGREVLCVDGHIEWISGAKWHTFREQQKRLLEQRSPTAVAGTPLLTASIELPDGTRPISIDGEYILYEGSATYKGRRLDTMKLRWYLLNPENGPLKWGLSFSNLVSDPVTINLTHGIPDTTNIVFRMRNKL